MSLDTHLRQKLESFADSAPVPRALLDAVRQRSRRRRIRRRTVGSVVGVFLVACLTVTSIAVLRPGDAGVAAATHLALVPPTFQIPAFPVTPGWTPPGLDAQPATGYSPEGMWLQYPGSSEIFVEITPHGSTLKPSIGGLGRQLPDGRWLTVAGSAPAATLQRFLDGLAPQPMPVPSPFTFELAPEDVVPILVQGTTTGFLPPIMQLQSPDGRVNASVELVPREQEPTLGFDASGLLAVARGTNVLVVSLTVEGSAAPHETLTRFVDGIHVTDHAVLR